LRIGLAPAMRRGAELRLATDVADYAAHARAVLGARADFTVVSDGPDPWPGWSGTRYEAKALRAGRAPCYQIWRRV
jgi:tRNA (guanine-N7-)-methyltransferase